MGCTLSIVNQSALVDSKTKGLVSAKPVVTKTSSEWVPWTMPTELIKDLQLDTVSNAEHKNTFGLTFHRRQVVRYVSQYAFGINTAKYWQLLITLWSRGCRIPVEYLLSDKK
jgi:hypothetical protein